MTKKNGGGMSDEGWVMNDKERKNVKKLSDEWVNEARKGKI